MKQKTYIPRSGCVSLTTPFFKPGCQPLTEQPRPQFARKDYIILNGEWDYAIRPQGEALDGYDGKITVPFSPKVSATTGMR